MFIKSRVYKIIFVLTIIFSLLTNPYLTLASAEEEVEEQADVSENESNDENVDKEAEETASPSEENVDSATLRLVFTSDVHGQLTTADYETGGGDYATGGYSKTVTLIKEAKAEVAKENSLLFDLGDNLYDYTTDYIYNYDSTAVQPIFSAIAQMNYDAVTLGNHEFDYTLAYLKNQLTKSGLANKVVLSNVKDAVTKKNVWAENKILTKTIVTEAGETMSVKVGLIGETVPGLSKKRTSYTGVLETEDIVENAKKEAAELRAKGADIVVVIAHSGIGGTNPTYMDANTGYALTKIEGVDAVLCGHSHRNFPDRDKATIYDSLPGVDLKTGLVNGKPLVQVQNRGASIGIADLKLRTENSKIVVADSETEVRKVTADTEVDAAINTGFGSWANIFMSDCSEILCKIDSDVELQNYFGALEDTDAIQLLNNIKLSYALRYTRTEATQYRSYPLVAASNYIKYGSEDDNDYVDISKNFKRSSIYNLVKYRTGLYLYQMTGAQLKEWLEWSASGYEEPGKNVLLIPGEDSSSPIAAIVTYQYEKQLQYAIKEEYLTNWDNFFFFDGIEYTIDTTISPRYDGNGNRISDTNRVTSFTRNGRPISDDTVFVVATHRLPSNYLFDKMNPTKIISTSTETYRNYQESYLRKIAQSGTLAKIADHNWKLKFSEEYNYLLQSSVRAENLLESRAWIPEMIGTLENRGYYLADFSQVSDEDTEGPCLNAIALKDTTTKKSVSVTAWANDVSDLASLQFIRGKYTADSGVWQTASPKKLTNGSTFLATENGTYSILATDGKGNRRIAYVRILNINKNALEVPTVNGYTNRKTYISGKAEPNTTIYFRVENGKVYSSKVNSSGNFKYKLPPQNAGSTIYVYVKDSKGRSSAKTVVSVKRTGPNKPALDTVKSSSRIISGRIRDTYAYPMILIGGKRIYVPNTAVKAYYQKSNFYNKKYIVKICPTTISANGTFRMTLPSYPAGNKSVQLKTVDVANRCSLETHVTCKLVVPNKPTNASEVTNLSRTVQIYAVQNCPRAGVLIGKKVYVTKKSIYNKTTKKYCYTVSIPRTDSTQVLRLFLSNSKGRSKMLRVRPKEKAPDMPVIDRLVIGKKVVTGKVDMVSSLSGNTKVNVYINGKRHPAKIAANGKFKVALKKPLKKGNRVVCKASNSAGKSLARRLVVK